MYRYYLALRFILSRPINLLGIIGVGVGVWALIVVVSIFDGYKEELTDQITMTSADIVIFSLGDKADFEELSAIILADTNVAQCSPRLIWQGLVHPRSGDEVRSFIPGDMLKNGRYLTLTGIDPRLESLTTGFEAWTTRVEPELQTDVSSLAQNEGWILVSADRAESKGLRRGDKLTVTTFSEGLNKIELDVIGAFETKHAGYDRLTAFLPIRTLRERIAPDKPGFVNEVAVKVRDTDPTAIAETKTRVATALIRSGLSSLDLAIISAGEEEEFFVQAVIHQSGLMKVVLFVIMVVAGFLVYATLSMMVTEKTHDIGVLAALGGTRSGILQVFLTCGFAIAMIGTILGMASGCVTSIYLNDFNEFLKGNFGIDLFPSEVYKLPEVPYYLDAKWIGIVALSSLVLGLVAAALPAIRAVRHDPLTILRDT